MKTVLRILAIALAVAAAAQIVAAQTHSTPSSSFILTSDNPTG